MPAAGRLGQATQRIPYVVSGTSGAKAPVVVAYAGVGGNEEPASQIIVQTLDATNGVRVYFTASASTYWTVKPGVPLRLEGELFTVWIEADAATPNYQILCTADKFRTL